MGLLRTISLKPVPTCSFSELRHPKLILSSPVPMVANLPENVRVGVVPVAIGGANIVHLDKDFDPASIANEADWYKSFMAAYDNEPYKRLVECARIAQKDGVIKGILLHQGETNNGDQTWPAKVKKIYEDLLADIGQSNI